MKLWSCLEILSVNHIYTATLDNWSEVILTHLSLLPFKLALQNRTKLVLFLLHWQIVIMLIEELFMCLFFNRVYLLEWSAWVRILPQLLSFSFLFLQLESEFILHLLITLHVVVILLYRLVFVWIWVCNLLGIIILLSFFYIMTLIKRRKLTSIITNHFLSKDLVQLLLQIQ